MKIIAVCTGQVSSMMYRTASGDLRTVASGIKKQAVSTLKNPIPVQVNRLGLEGDEQSDLSVHGGLDKAIYMMPAQHYAFWKARRAEQNIEDALNPGLLGENLIVQGLSEEDARIGDELRIGNVILRITDPREPCYKFAIRMGYSAAPKQMIQAGNCGWYLKVIQTGTLKAGDAVELIRTGEHPTVKDIFSRLTKKGQMDLL